VTLLPAAGAIAPTSTNAVGLVVPEESAGARLDRFAARALDVSRSEVKRWIERGRVTVEGVCREASTTLKVGDRVVVVPDRRASTDAAPDNGVRFDVLHADDDIVVVDKPAGLVVHPSRGHAGGTLVNGLLGLGLFRNEDFAGERGSAENARPGIVHRLDKGTSGVMVVARNAHAREKLKAQFQEHSIDRAYAAIVIGIARSGTLSTLHGRHPRDRVRFTTHVLRGKRAVTHVRVVGPLDGATLVECTLETGRTHQIRVHLSESGTPVLGDTLYGKGLRSTRLREVSERLGHQALHARLLGLTHPRTGERLRFETAPPPDFAAAVEALRC
jgi:23S rRNA pseudouridine1911/1915/1917 synthase